MIWRSLLIGAALCLPTLGEAADPPACPQAFSEFLSRFEVDAGFQASSIQFPLRVAYLDTAANAEPTRKSKRISRDGYTKSEHPLYPTPELRAKLKLERRVKEVSSTKAVVGFHQPESDAYAIEYHFTKARGCWRLTFMDDHSL